MTIYSQHPQRGKVQILANYRGPNGDVVSSTITSVESATVAAPIVDALNRTSACATVPVSVHDMRERRVQQYPDGHLAALTDRAARADLLTGSHSLWYGQAMWLLDEALRDLDDATASVPAPVRMALDTELETEARWLRVALAHFMEGVKVPNDDTRRCWDFKDPFVAFEGGVAGLSREDRELLDRCEAEVVGQALQDAVDDLRLLLDADAQCAGAETHLEASALSITAEPETMDGFYLNVEAPLPGGDYNRVKWAVGIDRWEVDEWEVDEDGERYPGEAHGEPVIVCELAERPSVKDIVELLDQCTSQEQLVSWSRTPPGEPLANTAFIVTKRYDESEMTP